MLAGPRGAICPRHLNSQLQAVASLSHPNPPFIIGSFIEAADLNAARPRCRLELVSSWHSSTLGPLCLFVRPASCVQRLRMRTLGPLAPPRITLTLFCSSAFAAVCSSDMSRYARWFYVRHPGACVGCGGARRLRMDEFWADACVQRDLTRLLKECAQS